MLSCGKVGAENRDTNSSSKYLFTELDYLIKENSLHITAESQEQNVGGGKSESAASLLQVREVRAVAEQ